MLRIRVKEAMPMIGLGCLLVFVGFAVRLGVLSLAFYGAGVILLLQQIWKISRTDRYDLQGLEEVHLQQELRQIEEFEEDAHDNVLCLCCRAVYSVEFPTCPECGGKSCC